MWHSVSKAVVTAVVVSALGLGGCQVSGSDVSERDGYFTWVDERGQVRYSRIPVSDSSETETETETKTKTNSEAQGVRPVTEPTDEYTLENYPDGDELAARGNVRPGQRQPYFTWRDADGNVRVSYYTPDGRERPPWGSDKPPVTLTESTVYLPEAGEATTPPVEGYDPDAMTILGIEATPESPFLRFSRDCCQELTGEDRIVWQEGREFAVRIDGESPSHTFSTGPSRYQIVAIPAGDRQADFVMRLRSYARDGVLVPSLAFVDEDFEPVRVVTDLVMPFTPETWRKRGYLEAWVPVFPQRGERWLVLFTRPEDLRGQTLYDGEKAPVAIPHADMGELGIATFED